MKTFYWYFRPFAIFGKIIGVFPLEYVLCADPKNLRYRPFSPTALYSLTLFCLFNSMLYYFSEFLFFLQTSQMFLHIVVYMIFLRSTLCFFLSGSHLKNLPKLIQLLDIFDRKRTDILINKPYNNFVGCILKILLPAFFTGLFMYWSFIESSALLQEIFPRVVTNSVLNSDISAIFFGIMSVWQIIPPLLYEYFASAIICNFKNINDTLRFKKYTGNFHDTNVKYDVNMAESLEDIRYLHNMLSQCVHELGICFGNFMAVDRLCIITMFVVNISAFLHDDNHNEHLLLITLMNVIIVLSVILTSEGVKQSGSEVVNLLYGIRFSSVNEKTREEIKMFLIQLSVRPIEISAAGYFYMDRGEIACILSAVATYLIVIVQFMEDMKYKRCCIGDTNDTWLINFDKFKSVY